MMAEDQGEDPQWDLKYRSEEEMDFFTEMALHETERWMEAVTRQKFQYPDDPRKSLESGVLLCELLNCLKAGSVKKINQFSTPLAGLDNINIFLEVCRNTFGLTDAQLFDAGDLEDLSQRAIADESYSQVSSVSSQSNQLKEENDRRLRNVAVTIYWLGHVASSSNFEGPELDFNAFSGLFEHHHVNLIPEKTSVYSSYWENKRLQSNHSSKPGTIHEENAYRDHEDQHAGDSSYESIGSKGSDDTQSVGSVDGMLVKSDIYQFGGSMSSLNKNHKVYSGNVENDMYQSTPNIYQGSHRSSPSVDSADGMSVGGHSRQSSGSTENYPTRSTNQRPLSALVDPLQFVKPKENALAKQAEHQLKIATENKDAKVVVAIDKEEDWQNNLKSWKSKRRQSYHRSIDLDEGKDEPVKRSTKTYKEILAARGKRNSMKIPYYADTEEEDWQQNDYKSTQSASDDNLRTSFSSESGNSTGGWGGGGHKDDDDVFDDRKNQPPSESIYPVSNRIEKQEVNNNINNNNNNKAENNYNLESHQKEPILQPSREPEKLVSKEIVIPDSTIPETTSSVNLETTSSVNLETKSSVNLETKSSTIPEIKSSTISETNSYTIPETKSSTISETINSTIPETMNNTIPEAMNSTSLVLQPQAASITMAPPKSERTNARTDKGNKVDTYDAQEEWVQNEGEDFVERIIKISQRLKNEKGFGFFIKGGSDQKGPISVNRIRLGGAADVCELRVKDVIISINKVDVRQFTHEKAQQQINKAAQMGQIELRVRRYFRGSAPNSDDGLDFLSDEEPEPEPEYIPRSRRTKSIPETPSTAIPDQSLPPPPPQLLNEPQINEVSEDSHSTQPMFPDVVPPPVSTEMSIRVSDQITEENLPPPPPPPVDDYQLPPEPMQHSEEIPQKIIDLPESNDMEPSRIISDIQSSIEHPPVPDSDPTPVMHQRTSSSESISSNSSIQPPALLLRWQTRARGEENKTPTESVKMESDSSANVNSSTSQGPRRRSFFQNEKLYGLDTTKKRPDNLFIVRDIRQTLEKETNSIFLAPVDGQATKTNVVTSKEVQPAPRSTSPPQKQTEVSTSHIDVNSSPLVIQIPTQNNSDSLLQIDLNNQQMMQPQSQNGANHLPEYTFRVDLSKKKPVESELKSQITFSTESSLHAQINDEHELEAADNEKLRIAEETTIAEERRLIEEEKHKRLEEERLRQEAEEKKRLEKKKEQIRLGEEKLARKQRELELAQQEIEENRRRLQQEHELIEQRKREQEELLRMKEEQLKKDEQLRLQQQQEQLRKLEEEKVRLQQLQKQIVVPVSAPVPTPVLTPQRYQSPPQSYQTAVSVEATKTSPRSLYNQNQITSQTIRSTNALPKPYSSVQISHQKKPVLSGKMESVISRFDKPEEEVRHSQKLTREDLLAMNRKATPLQKKPEISPTSSQRMSPISREPPSKTELHSLNAVPKAKHRDPKEWIVSDRGDELERKQVNQTQAFRQPMGRQQEIQSNLQVHWVIEEAERRRNKGPSHNDYSKPVNYPIQPAEGHNAWRDFSGVSQKGYSQPIPKNPAYDRTLKSSPNGSVRPSASLETLNQANPRASYASYGSSVSPRSLGSPSNVGTSDSYGDNNTTSEGYESLSAGDSVSPRSSGSLSNQATIDSNSNSMLISHQREDSTSSKHSGKSIASSNSDLNEQVAVCGTEKCSHCLQELGFGAAMVIESLHLYYHVKCFRCCVCSIQLGNGSQGADVRVRGHKLHCHNCYSNDEALKNSVHVIDLLSPDSVTIITTTSQ